MKKRRFVSVLFIVFFSLTFVTPIDIGMSSPHRPLEDNLHPAISLVKNPHNETVPLNNTDKSMLQFKSGGHILGFQPNKAYLAGMDHALSVEFMGTAGVMPQGESEGGNETRGAPALKKVSYAGLWPGISVIYETAKDGITESTYHLAPGADLSKIRLRYNVPVEKQKDGSLRFTFERGFVAESAPVAWQEIGGRRVPVEVSFRVLGSEVGFSAGKYEPGFPLVIDPTYVWHTFYGSASEDRGYGIAVDGSGNVYVTGYSTDTWNGPTGQSPLHAYSGNQDIFVLKLNSSGAYQWHTFYGSASRDDTGFGIAVEGSGNVYVTGDSRDTWNGPAVTDLPLNSHSAGFNLDIFVLKLNSSGAYQWHTFYGSTAVTDIGQGIAVDGSGSVYVTGNSFYTWNGPAVTDLPLNSHSPGSGNGDIFVLKLNSSSGAYQWHTFYGSSYDDSGYGIAVDGGNVYVAGFSYATWYGPSPGFASPLNDHSSGNNYDIFVLKLDSSGTYQWHTFYGSALEDRVRGIAVYGGNVYVTGFSFDTWNGPAVTDLPLNDYSGGQDIFVLKLDSSGTYQWHTFYGSASEDRGYGIAVYGSGNVYVAGYSSATWNGPGSTAPLNAFIGVGGQDIFVLKLDSSGTYQWHTFYGSTVLHATVLSNGIAVDGSGSVYVTGASTATWDGPAPDNKLPLNSYSGDFDIVVLKMSDPPPAPPASVPTVNEWGMIIFMLLAGLGGVYYLRRQRRT